MSGILLTQVYLFNRHEMKNLSKKDGYNSGTKSPITENHTLVAGFI